MSHACRENTREERNEFMDFALYIVRACPVVGLAHAGITHGHIVRRRRPHRTHILLVCRATPSLWWLYVTPLPPRRGHARLSQCHARVAPSPILHGVHTLCVRACVVAC
jgi:hypothetical protein